MDGKPQLIVLAITREHMWVFRNLAFRRLPTVVSFRLAIIEIEGFANAR